MIRNLILSTMMLGSLFLVGCVSAKAITGPDGSPHQLISCARVEDCYTKATEVCGGKYQIVNTSTTGGSEGGSSTNLLVKCESKAQ